MPSFQELFDGVSQGVGDNVRAGVADVQNHYQEFLTGRPAPQTSLTADMEYVTLPQEAEPQSYGAALRTHSDMEQAEIRAQYEAGQGATPGPQPEANYSPSVAPPEPPGYEPEV